MNVEINSFFNYDCKCTIFPTCIFILSHRFLLDKGVPIIICMIKQVQSVEVSAPGPCHLFDIFISSYMYLPIPPVETEFSYCKFYLS